jgi:hypothetical protein
LPQICMDMTNARLTISFRLIPSGSRYHIQLLVRINDSRFSKSLKNLQLSADDWDNQRCLPFPKDNTRQITEELIGISASLFRLYKEAEIKNQFLTSEELKKQFLAPSPALLFQTLHLSNNDTLSHVGKTITYERYQFQLEVIQLVPLFIQTTYGLPDISISALPDSFPGQLSQFLALYTADSDKTKEQLRYICSLLLRENRKKSISLPLPLKRLLVRICVPSHELTVADIIKLQEMELPRQYAGIRDAFIFSAYTGLRYESIKQLTGRNIRIVSDQSVWLFFSDVQYNLSRLPKTLQRELSGTKDSNFLFNLPSIQFINLSLRSIAVRCQLNVDFTFKSGRKFYLSKKET